MQHRQTRIAHQARDDSEAFAPLLRRLRKAQPLTQAALAQQAACAIDTIKKIEAGVRHPSLQLATQLADSLGLVGGERATFLASAGEVGGNTAGTAPAASPVVDN